MQLPGYVASNVAADTGAKTVPVYVGFCGLLDCQIALV